MKTLIIDGNYQRAEIVMAKLGNYAVAANHCPTLSDAVDVMIYSDNKYDTVMINDDEYDEEDLQMLKKSCPPTCRIVILGI